MGANLNSETNDLAERQRALVQSNIDLLLQGITLLSDVTDSAYRDPVPALMMQSVGPQLRHVVEFYECFLDGLEAGRIDYDARRRDELLQASRTVAITRMYCIAARLATLTTITGDAIIWSAMEDCPHDSPQRFLTSSIGRELQVLASHTTHHYALIAFILAAQGITVCKDFGTAPSTLRFRKQQNARDRTEAA